MKMIKSEFTAFDDLPVNDLSTENDRSSSRELTICPTNAAVMTELNVFCHILNSLHPTCS